MNKENNKKDSPLQAGYNFLLDDDFIRWRLLQTKELDEYWSGFLLEHPHLEQSFHDAVNQFDAVRINQGLLSDKDRVDIYRAVQSDVSHYKRRKLLKRVSAVAAIFIVAIISLLFFVQRENITSGSIREDEMILGEALPEEEIYIISGNEKINISNHAQINLTEEGRALVTDSGVVEKELELASVELNKLVVPYGKRTNLTLPDGTEVWLNSGTQLDFPSVFHGDKREISVDGEIFINVAHNPDKPFVVHVHDMDVLVHGTSFNISAYRDDESKTIVLVEGKVKVLTADNRTAEMNPHEKIEITNSEIKREEVDVAAYTSWTKGVLEFNGAPISEILKKVGRYYNVSFENQPDVKINHKTCSGKLFLSNNLDSVMMSVSVLSSTVYERRDNIIYISKK